MSIDAEYSPMQPTIDSPLHEVLDPDRRIPTDYSIASQAESEWFDAAVTLCAGKSFTTPTPTIPLPTAI